jgi:D-alanyl-D-alanine carboxypeptidase
MKKFTGFALVFISYQSLSQPFIKIADSIRKYRSVPGIVYAVFSDDRIMEVGAIGIRTLKNKDSIRVRDRFHIGTNTGAFTSYIAARLSETGKLSWNTPVIKLFPDLNGHCMKLYQQVTLQQFLSQRGGVKPYAELNDFQNLPSLAGNYLQQRREFVPIILQQPPVLIVDSSKVVYSVAGTAIGAAMMEKATGKPWEDLVDMYICKPLNIEVKFGLPNFKDSSEPSGHWDQYGYLSAEPGTSMARPIPAVMPAMDINISVKDYVMFMQDFLKALQHKKSFIGYNSAEQLLFGYPGYSLGWENERWQGMNVAHFLGKGSLFTSYAAIIKEKNIGIIVMCNSGALGGRGAALNLGRLLAEYYTR